MELKIFCGKKFFNIAPSTDKQVKKGERFACPNDCPNMGQCSVMKDGGFFLVKSANPTREKENLIPCYFSEGEQAWMIGEEPTQSVSEAVTPNDYGADLGEIGDGLEFGLGDDTSEIKACETESDFSAFGVPYDDSEEDTEAVSFSSMSMDGNFFQTLNRAQAIRGTDDEGIKVNDIFINVPQRDFIQIETTIYSNNFRKYKRAEGLRRALSNIFYHWRTGIVFDGPKQLTNEFKWLLLNVQDCLDESGKKLVFDILEDEDLSIDQKFFYIFYCVVYKKNTEIHFYYKDSNTNGLLTPIFNDRIGFAKAMCGKEPRDELVRRLYKSHQREILHYLGYLKYEDIVGDMDCGERIEQKEKELFHDLVMELSREMGQIAYFEREANEILVSNFGSAGEFCERMQTPAPLSDMRAKSKFLKSFKIDSLHRIGPYREGEEVLYKEISFDSDDAVKPKNVVYDIIGLKQQSRYLTEYGYYISLLREYARIFNPARMILPGGVVLTRDNFFGDIKKITGDAVMCAFIEGEDAKRAVGRGCFVKNLIDNKVIEVYVKANQNNQLEDILKLLDMVINANGNKAMPTEILKRYLELYGSEAMFIINSRVCTINSYVNSLLENSVTAMMDEIHKNPIIKAYIALEKEKCANGIKAVKDNMKKMEDLAKKEWQDRK